MMDRPGHAVIVRSGHGEDGNVEPGELMISGNQVREVLEPGCLDITPVVLVETHSEGLGRSPDGPVLRHRVADLLRP